MTKLHKTILAFIVTLSLLFLLLPQYARRALIYTTVGIEDYKIFENREIEAIKGKPWPKASHFNQNSLTPKEESTIKDYKTVAFLIIQDQKIVFEKYWDDFGPSSLSNSFSAAKSIVALLVGAAINDGFIESVDQPIGDFIPEFKNQKELTIRHVLTMSSGLNWKESYSSLFSTTTEAYYGNDLPNMIRTLRVEEPPGEIFKYLSGNTQLLGMVVTQATGSSLSEYASKKLWIPIEAQNNALWSLDKKEGIEKCYCCFNSNARDFARIGQLILNHGKWNNRQIIDSTFIAEATQPAGYLKTTKGFPVDFYGFQWWIHQYKNFNIPYARGILGQYIFVIPEKRAVVVRLGHKRSKETLNHHPEDTYFYLNTAFRILKGN